jgi:hypothetical protein
MIFRYDEKSIANGFSLVEEADCKVLNCLPPLNLIRSTKLDFSNEPAFLPNACYLLYFLFVRVDIQL